MQSIDAYVSRPSATGLTLRKRLEDIRELCDLAFVARSRLLDLHDAETPVEGTPQSAGWLQWWRAEKMPRQ